MLKHTLTQFKDPANITDEEANAFFLALLGPEKFKEWDEHQKAKEKEKDKPAE